MPDEHQKALPEEEERVFETALSRHESLKDTRALLRRLSDLLYRIFKFKVVVYLLFLRKRLHAVLSPRTENDAIMINLGGGIFLRPHWKVMDYVSPYYPFAQRLIDYNVDVTSDQPFPLDDGTVSFFYSAHMLEHIPQEHCLPTLKEIYRCLGRNGAVRLNMPDYDQMRQAVSKSDEDYFRQQVGRGMLMEEAVVEQIATERIGNEDPERIRENYHSMTSEAFANYYTAHASRHVQRENAGYHINWFNYEKLERMLREAGFSRIYRSTPQGSPFKELRGEGGWITTGDFFEIKRLLGLDTTHPDKSLFVEAVK